MSDVVSIVIITLAVIQALGTIMYLVSAGRLLRSLEAQHPTVHESIGRPLLIAHNTPRNNLLFFRWLWGRDYETLPNSDSLALARLVRAQLVWLLIGFAVLVAMFVVFGTTL